ncbi:MAG: hypothetical protein ABJL72_12270 [Roseobacter sp.]
MENTLKTVGLPLGLVGIAAFAFSGVLAPPITMPDSSAFAVDLARTLVAFGLLAAIVDLAVFISLRLACGKSEVALKIEAGLTREKQELAKLSNPDEAPKETMVNLDRLMPLKKDISKRKVQMAVAIGLGLGLCISVSGFRLLASVFPAYGEEPMNMAFDVFVTTLVLAGGSEGIHRLTRKSEELGILNLTKK